MKFNHLTSLVRKLTKLIVAVTLLLKAILKLLDMAVNYLPSIFLSREYV